MSISKCVVFEKLLPENKRYACIFRKSGINMKCRALLLENGGSVQVGVYFMMFPNPSSFIPKRPPSHFGGPQSSYCYAVYAAETRDGQEKIPVTYGGVGGWSKCLFWDFFRLFVWFFPRLFALFLLFFSILASKFGSSRKNGSLLDVKTMFRSDIFRNVG